MTSDRPGVFLEGDWPRVEITLRNLASADLRGVSEEIGEILLSSTKGRFRTSIGPDGTRWKPHAPIPEPQGDAKKKRRRKKKRKTRTRTLLLDTGRLRGSIHYAVTQDGVQVGTNVVYARAHQLGYDPETDGGKGPVKLPPRPYLGVSQDDERDIREALDAWIQELAR